MKNLALLIFVLFSSTSFSQSLTNGLVGHFSFNNGDASDESSTQKDGSISGAQLTTDRFGNKDNAYLFDGFNDLITATTDNRNIKDKLTIALWIEPTDTNPYAVLLSKYDWVVDKGYSIRLRELDNAAMEGRDSNGKYVTSNSDKTSLYDPVNGGWHFLVGTVDRSVWTIYVDGKKISSNDTKNTKVALDNPSTLTIGAGSTANGNGNRRHFGGKIDDIRIYNRALTAAEINLLHNEPNPDRPIANMVVSTDTACVGDTIFFDGNGSMSSRRYEWKIANADNSFLSADSTSVEAVWDTPGTYEVKLVTLKDTMKSAPVTRKVVISGYPVPTVMTAWEQRDLKNQICESDTLKVLEGSTTDSNSTLAYQYRVWSGKGVAKSGSNYVFDPAVAGVGGPYELTYTVTNIYGCTDSVKEFVSVDQEKSLSFSVEIDKRTVTFTQQISGSDDWLWDFGDGNISTIKNPVHTYNTNGSYRAKLSTNDWYNVCPEVSDSVLLEIFVVSLSTANEQLSMYPVPFNTNLHVDLGSAKGSLEIYDQLGKRIYQNEYIQGTEVLDLSHLPAGVMVARIVVDGQVYEKIISKN